MGEDMSLFDRFKKKEEEKPKKKDESKNDFRSKTEDRDAEWAATVEKPRPVEEKTESKKTVKKEPKKETKKETKNDPKKEVKNDPKKEVKKETKKEEPKMAEKKPAAKKSDVKVWHISKREEDGQWQVKAQGAQKATKLFRTKAEAEEYVKTLKANNEGSRVIKHKKTGEFQKK